ncbi:hypothetical protein EDB81DRAFT_293593 [Dactylonectria macrodidyma]|uniref:C2H2-type domain-containing protein n=1 Tax=Dactylonectria macrodidyma TaxID=307937 RepID=A0A9P9ICF0_9HYPO|nr:hypothetical protein EDB81DRAFT_293593 [Dactylonectria macrodidyma]
MSSKTFECDVCSMSITLQDVKTHVRTHQAQILDLLDRLPDIPIDPRTSEDPVHNPHLPCRIAKRHATLSLPGAQHHKRARIPRDRPFQCPKCPQQIDPRRPNDFVRHYSRHYPDHPRRIKCPICNMQFLQMSVFNIHPCFAKENKPSPELIEFQSRLRGEIEQVLGLEFNHRKLSVIQACTPDVPYITPTPPGVIPSDGPVEVSHSRQETITQASEGARTRPDISFSGAGLLAADVPYWENVSHDAPIEMFFQGNLTPSTRESHDFFASGFDKIHHDLFHNTLPSDDQHISSSLS